MFEEGGSSIEVATGMVLKDLCLCETEQGPQSGVDGSLNVIEFLACRCWSC